jgi:hypothetical protein
MNKILERFGFVNKLSSSGANVRKISLLIHNDFEYFD